MNEQKTWHELIDGSLDWQTVIQKKKFYELCLDSRQQQLELYSNAFSRWRLNQTDPNYLVPLRGQIVDCLVSINNAILYSNEFEWLDDPADATVILGKSYSASEVYGWNLLTDTSVGTMNSYRTIRNSLVSDTGSIMRYLEFQDSQAMDFGVVFEGGDFGSGKVMRVVVPCNTGMWLNVMASVVGKLVSYAGGVVTGFKESQLGRRESYSYNNQNAFYTQPLVYDSAWNYTKVETNGIECFLAAITDGWSHNTAFVARCEWALRYYSLLDSFYSAMASALNSDMSTESISKTARNWILSNIRNQCLWGNNNDAFIRQFNLDVGRELIRVDA